MLQVVYIILVLVHLCLISDNLEDQALGRPDQTGAESATN